MKMQACLVLSIIMIMVSFARAEHIDYKVDDRCGETVTYVKISDGTTKLSSQIIDEIANMKNVCLYLPASFEDTSHLPYLPTVMSIVVSLDNSTLMSYYGCIYSKDGKELILQPDGQSVKTLRIREGAKKLRLNSLHGDAETIILPSTMEDCITEIIYDVSFMESNRNIEVCDLNQLYQSIDGVLFTKDGKELLYYPSARKQKEYSIPSGVKKIGYAAFATPFLDAVSIPDSVEEIGEAAFWASGIEKITGGKSVKTIGGKAFAACRGLTKIDDLCSVEAFGEGAFDDSGLERITISSSVSYIPSMAFSNCYQLSEVYFENENVRIEEDAFERMEKLSDLSEQLYDNLTFYCTRNSSAAEYADKYKIHVQYIDRN